MSEKEDMPRFHVFGSLFVNVTKIACVEVEENSSTGEFKSVTVWFDGGAHRRIHGEDAKAFLEFVKKHKV